MATYRVSNKGRVFSDDLKLLKTREVVHHVSVLYRRLYNMVNVETVGELLQSTSFVKRRLEKKTGKEDWKRRLEKKTG